MGALVDYDKSELIDGVVYAMSPASIRHIRIQGHIHRLIGNFLVGKRCMVFSEAEVRFDEANTFIPDICIVCDPDKIKSSFIKGAPDFVAEILSPSTKKRDLTVKMRVYEKYGVREYWIVDPKAESIDVYLLKDGKLELDETYHNITPQEWEEMDEEERAQQRLSLKLSLYDELEIQIKEVFEL